MGNKDVKALTPREIELLSAIIKCKKERKIAPSHYELADQLKVSRWRIQNIIHQLIEKTYLTRETGVARSEVVERDIDGEKVRPF